MNINDISFKGVIF